MAETLQGTYEFTGVCARCRREIVAAVRFKADDRDVSPPSVIGSYCECGDHELPGGLRGAQAVPLTLRGDPA